MTTVMTTVMSETAAKMPGKTMHLDISTDGEAMLTIDLAGEKVNSLSRTMMEEFSEMLDRLEERKDDILGLAIISGKPDNFVAGADIKLLAQIQTAEEGEQMSRAAQQLFNRLEALPFPTIAAINGACMGGGLELALACRYRIVTNDPATQLALPEVQLGVIPGAGGTQRLPRLVGLKTALDMILTGKKIRASKAVKMGLAHEVVPKEVLAKRARQTVRRLGLQWRETGKIEYEPASQKRVAATVTDLLLQATVPGRMLMYRQAKAGLQKKIGKHYPAPYLALAAVFYSRGHDFEEGLEIEARYFGRLAVTDVCKNLIRLFCATTAMKGEPWQGADGKPVQPHAVNKVGVLGGGLMGSGIATVLVDKGVHTRVKDRDLASASKALQYVSKYLDGRVKRGQFRAYEKDMKMGLVSATSDYSGFKHADVVIEAVFEDIDIKHGVLRDIENLAGKETIFATNTSSIPITQIASASKHPETVIGMHFFSPVEKMPLLEVITQDKTADWVTATIVALGKKMGKHVIVVKDGPGFYTSRALSAMMSTAMHLFLEGAAIDVIDKAMTDFGFPVGPMTLMDEVGFDVAAKVTKILHKAFPERFDMPQEAQVIFASGRLGRKNGRGFYKYEMAPPAAGKKKGKQKKEVDLSIYDDLPARKHKSIPTVEQIQQRCVYAFLNEAALIKQEGILATPRDGDIGAIFGLGFPPFLGGPFRYMDAQGLDRVVKGMRQVGIEPAQLLVNMAESGRTFYGEGSKAPKRG
jgi:3-hydroxyacyl-CoA dehydrogenase/enoyl-CoA hydratase/3-hydroxybutyryl-CoA epimerase